MAPKFRGLMRSLAVVEDGLDIVAVGVEHESAVVARAVLRARSRLTVALVARLDERAPPCVDVVAAGSAEGDVQVARDCRVFEQRELTPVGKVAVVRGVTECKPVEA